jgi:hypothetical protein
MITSSGPTVITRTGPTPTDWMTFDGLLIRPLAVPPCALPGWSGAGTRRPGLEDVGPEGEPVDDRAGQARVGERLAPFAERGVAGDRDRGPLVALGQDLEEQLGTPPVEVQVSELVETQQVEPPYRPITLDSSRSSSASTSSLTRAAAVT